MFQITCAALGGHPAALLSWSEPQNASLNTNERPKITPSALAHATDVRHTAVYKANLNDNDREITCVATQIDHDGRTVLFESSTSLKLKIDKIILPVDNALTQKIGIISGVLLAIIFLILLLVFCIFVCCKRRRKRSRPSSSQATTESSPEPPIKPIWTTDRLLHPQASSSPDLAAKQLHHFTDILEPADVSGIGKSQNNGGVGKINGTASQGTMSTRSTTSQGSWEEDRSVGGEVEEVNITAPPSVANRGKNSPSLHETHFGSDLELPRTVLHHPDPYQFHHVPQQHVPYQQMAPPPAGPQHGRFSVGARPNSSAAEHHPMMYPYYPNSSHNTTFPQSGQRPTSALSFPANPQSMLVDPAFMVPGSRHLPTPNGQLTTSAKSVFDCDLGCFVDLDTGETVHSHPSSSEDSTPSRRTSDAKDI